MPLSTLPGQLVNIINISGTSDLQRKTIEECVMYADGTSYSRTDDLGSEMDVTLE